MRILTFGVSVLALALSAPLGAAPAPAKTTAAVKNQDAAIAQFFETAYEKYGLRNGKFITTAVYGDGKEYVTEEGLRQSFDAGGRLLDDGKFLLLWKKTPAGWKMFRDSFSSNHTL